MKKNKTEIDLKKIRKAALKDLGPWMRLHANQLTPSVIDTIIQRPDSKSGTSLAIHTLLDLVKAKKLSLAQSSIRLLLDFGWPMTDTILKLRKAKLIRFDPHTALKFRHYSEFDSDKQKLFKSLGADESNFDEKLILNLLDQKQEKMIYDLMCWGVIPYFPGLPQTFIDICYAWTKKKMALINNTIYRNDTPPSYGGWRNDNGGHTLAYEVRHLIKDLTHLRMPFLKAEDIIQGMESCLNVPDCTSYNKSKEQPLYFDEAARDYAMHLYHACVCCTGPDELKRLNLALLRRKHASRTTLLLANEGVITLPDEQKVFLHPFMDALIELYRDTLRSSESISYKSDAPVPFLIELRKKNRISFSPAIVAKMVGYGAEPIHCNDYAMESIKEIWSLLNPTEKPDNKTIPFFEPAVRRLCYGLLLHGYVSPTGLPGTILKDFREKLIYLADDFPEEVLALRRDHNFILSFPLLVAIFEDARYEYDEDRYYKETKETLLKIAQALPSILTDREKNPTLEEISAVFKKDYESKNLKAILYLAKHKVVTLPTNSYKMIDTALQKGRQEHVPTHYLFPARMLGIHTLTPTETIELSRNKHVSEEAFKTLWSKLDDKEKPLMGDYTDPMNNNNAFVKLVSKGYIPLTEIVQDKLCICFRDGDSTTQILEIAKKNSSFAKKLESMCQLT